MTLSFYDDSPWKRVLLSAKMEFKQYLLTENAFPDGDTGKKALSHLIETSVAEALENNILLGGILPIV
jgi:hypothetical protein